MYLHAIHHFFYSVPASVLRFTFCCSDSFLFHADLRILAGKIHPQIKLKRLRKSMNTDVTVVDALYQLFTKGSYTQITFSKK